MHLNTEASLDIRQGEMQEEEGQMIGEEQFFS
jgi:hypothetical protein